MCSALQRNESGENLLTMFLTHALPASFDDSVQSLQHGHTQSSVLVFLQQHSQHNAF